MLKQTLDVANRFIGMSSRWQVCAAQLTLVVQSADGSFGRARDGRDPQPDLPLG